MNAWRALARPSLALALTLAALLWVPATQVAAQTEAAIPAYEGYVTDRAHLFNDAQRAQLEAFLEQVHQKTQAQFAVLTVDSCAPEVPERFKTLVFQKWGIGDDARDDGLLLLVAMREGALRFETGYGLEGTLPDGWQARMLRRVAVPRFKAGDPAGGITQAVLETSARIAKEHGVTLQWDGSELRYSDRDTARRGPRIPPILIFLIVFAVLNALSRSGRRRRGASMGVPWWYGGGGGFGGGGGGFSGGGGGDFGGFGGGDSGGGGGGADF